jgi:hypothetical protein
MHYLCRGAFEYEELCSFGLAECFLYSLSYSYSTKALEYLGRLEHGLF